MKKKTKKIKEDSNWLFFIVSDLRIYEEEAVYALIDAHVKGDQIEIDKATDYYQMRNQLVSKALEHIECGKKDKFDWKWLADEGKLCDKDWEWFKEDLEKAGVSREAFDKKWK
jgi:hypothetical protein